MEGEASSEFQDWEVLHNSSESGLVNSPPDSVDDNFRDFQGIEGESEGMIRSDYFSLDNQGRYSNTTATAVVAAVDEEEEASVESDNPSWIDPVPASQTRKNSTDFWSDSGSDRSDERRFSDLDAKNELGFVDNVKSQVGVEGIGEIEANESENSVKFSDFDVKNQMGFVENAKRQVGLEGFGEIQETGGGNGSVSDELEGGDGHENVAIEEMKSGGEEEKRRMVAWWKVPFEVLKYCVFKVSPVWTLSMAAAVMGVFILGRRLYKMKRKTRSLQLKVTVDDKKVSQFMSRAARLNEAFSVVRRVPIVRPSLPATGLNPWPVMSLR